MQTFLRLKTVWSIVRPLRWLLRMPTDLNKCLTTYFDVLSALENFLSALEQSLFISKFSFLNKFWQNFASGELLRPWNPKNHQVVTFSLLKNCFKYRMMSPFASACCHGPKLIASNLFWCSQCLKKFLRHSQASGGALQRSILASNFASQEPKTLHNH